jgi:hypothetical protein
MGEKKEQWESDEARFGPVEQLSDLEPDKSPGPTLAKHQTEQLLKKDDSVGYFETSGASKHGLGAPLHLGSDFKKDGAPAVAEYQAAYNTYAEPLRMTLRAEGRIKDLALTNAPTTPAELEKDPKLATHFQNLKLTGSQDLALSSWSQAQNDMRTNITRYGGGQHVLAGAVANYARVQTKLEEKKKENERKNKLAEIAEIDETVKTLHEIINVTTEAWTLSGELDEIIGTSSFDENLEGDVVEGSKDAKPNWECGTLDDPTCENTKVSNKKQKAAGAVASLSSGTAEAYKIMHDAKAKIAAAGQFDLSIDGILTAVVGGKKYVKLKQEAAKLEAQIKKLGLQEEADDVRSATESLAGFKMTFKADGQQLSNDRTASRNFARNFATSVNAGESGVMAMYAAEAYQELAQFGALADKERKDLAPAWRAAHQYVSTRSIAYFQGHYMDVDRRVLEDNLNAVKEQGEYFAEHLPKWKITANQWNQFFGTHASHDLVHQKNKADQAQGD